MNNDKSKKNDTKTYSLSFTELQMNLIERLIKKYCKQTESGRMEIDNIPDGPCYPPIQGTASSVAKETAKALLYSNLETAYDALKEIKKVKTAV